MVQTTEHISITHKIATWIEADLSKMSKNLARFYTSLEKQRDGKLKSQQNATEQK